MRKFTGLTLLLLFYCAISRADSAKKIEITPFGYIKVDNYLDTRQNIGYAENQELLFPKRKRFDRFCRDINAHPQAHIVAMESTAGLSLSGVEISDNITAKGWIEGYFLGTNYQLEGPEFTLNNFTLYRTYLQLETKKYEFLMGQYWHPIYVDDCYPKTIGFADGGPIETQAWNPQIRFTYKHDNWQVLTAMLSERDLTSDGPDGFSSIYIRNAAIPNLNLLIKRTIDQHFCGIDIDFKRLIPRLVTCNNFKADESINSWGGAIFTLLNYDPFSIRLKLIYMQNGTDMDLLSAYAIQTQDPVTNRRKYIPTAVVSAWVDWDYIFKDHHETEIGCFVGYTQNLGAPKSLFIDPRTSQPVVYGIGPDIAYVFKFQPRIIFKYTPAEFAFELEYDRAAYGKLNNFGKPVNTIPVNNLRFLFAAYYRF